MQFAKMGCLPRSADIAAWIVTAMALAAASGGTKPAGNRYSYSSDPVQDYRMLPTSRVSGQERALCFGKLSRCQMRTMVCPRECPVRKPAGAPARGRKACLIDCSSKCETSCKVRRPNCQGYGAVCYDPRFVGGDGVMFYFHGAKDRDFALVSDSHVQINAHFIGHRPAGRRRDFTWIQALGILFGAHSLTVSASGASTWNATADHLAFAFDGREFDVASAWTSPSGDVVVERTDEANAVSVILPGTAEVSVGVAPVDAEDDRVHNYRLPPGDAFAHLEVQFKLLRVSPGVEGVLGQTYRPSFQNPVNRTVAMPVMGGEDRYATSSLLSADCRSCRFSSSSPSDFAPISPGCESAGAGAGGGGVACRR